jgi:GNAT superfamily N-acetyltransferase
MHTIQLRDYSPTDAAAVNALAVTAFEEFSNAYDDWSGFKTKISAMSSLATSGEIVVAEHQSRLVGAVAYIGPHKPKSEIFRPEWPIMRMLVVSPEARGLGAGRALAEECLARAKRDKAVIFALHTSELMAVALSMYQRMGFRWWASAPLIHGVPYGIYIKNIDG